MPKPRREGINAAYVRQASGREAVAAGVAGREGVMGDAKDWLTAATRQAGDLLAGESFVAAHPFAWRGNIMHGAAGSAGLIVGKLTTGSIHGVSLPRTMVFGLTSSRLFVFELVTKTATAGEAKAIVPLQSISGVMSRKFRQLLVPRLNVDITFHDNEPLLAEAGGFGLDKAERFVAALVSAVPRHL